MRFFNANRSGLGLTFLAALSFVSLAGSASADTAYFGVAPDNDLELLTQTLQSAKKEILINVYQFDSPTVTQAVLSQIQAGLTVKILLEGSPIPKISDEERKTISEVVNAMRASGNHNDHLFIMKKWGDSRRFKYDHAKYVVIDRARSLVTSENYTTTGHPTAGKVGNRGWEVVIDNSDLANHLTQMFASDTDTSQGDVEDQTTRYAAAEPISNSADKTRFATPIELAQGNLTGITIITSPDSRVGITQFIQSAQQTLEVEEMSLPLYWKKGTEESAEMSPISTEIIAAARRGVNTRVLLNDDSVFGGNKNGALENESNQEGEDDSSSTSKQDNQNTVDYLNQLASQEHLQLEARIVDIQAVEITYIHNKGMIADDARALVSSINGTKNSVMNNRELALNLESTDAATYYRGAFDFDWSKSTSRHRSEILDLTALLFQ